ncbi:MAG: YggS family pyridoxal phosphate-dependent enzyme [Actinobacteria bacterium]|nr:YggS family pyridoxal phosphate-dependent enzyme [Actinomycetota bacterium]MCL5887286.1 YggS family pyridoxal phosphate-dependent enzyme [Actinomycetota bacterium]
MGAIAERYEWICRQVAEAADHVGRDACDITVVAVTKNVGVPEIQQALAAGILDLGENRVQEFSGKQAMFPEARWHFIGTLQTNKAKHVVGKAHLIHSVDSLRLLETIDSRAADVDVRQPVLLQVNVAGEATKHGFAPCDLADVLLEADKMDNIVVKGLMTMAPFGSPEDQRWVFQELREVRDNLCVKPHNGVELDELSMGMTNDYRVAVEEGSTIVRIGRAIFGR